MEFNSPWKSSFKRLVGQEGMGSQQKLRSFTTAMTSRRAKSNFQKLCVIMFRARGAKGKSFSITLGLKSQREMALSMNVVIFMNNNVTMMTA